PLRLHQPTVRDRRVAEALSQCHLQSLHGLAPEVKLETYHIRGRGVSMLDYIAAEDPGPDLWVQPRVHDNWGMVADHWLLSSRRRGLFQPKGAALTTLRRDGPQAVPPPAVPSVNSLVEMGPEPEDVSPSDPDPSSRMSPDGAEVTPSRLGSPSREEGSEVLLCPPCGSERSCPLPSCPTVPQPHEAVDGSEVILHLHHTPSPTLTRNPAAPGPEVILLSQGL